MAGQGTDAGRGGARPGRACAKNLHFSRTKHSPTLARRLAFVLLIRFACHLVLKRIPSLKACLARRRSAPTPRCGASVAALPFALMMLEPAQCTVYVADSSNFWVLSADSNVFRLSASIVMKRNTPFPKQQFCASFFADSPPSQVVARSALIVPAAVTLCTGDVVLSRVGGGKSAELFVPHCFICATSDNMCAGWFDEGDAAEGRARTGGAAPRPAPATCRPGLRSRDAHTVRASLITRLSGAAHHI